MDTNQKGTKATTLTKLEAERKEYEGFRVKTNLPLELFINFEILKFSRCKFGATFFVREFGFHFECLMFMVRLNNFGLLTGFWNNIFRNITMENLFSRIF